MIQVCGLRTTCSCSRGLDVAPVRLSIQRYAAMTARTASPAYTKPAVCRWSPPSLALTSPKIPAPPMMTGSSSWITATPALPPAALRPSAAPFLAAG